MARTTMALALVLLVTPASRADGLIYQLPADGTWARFAGSGRLWDAERIVPPGGKAEDDESPPEEYARGGS
jgi:hypothetical protein